MWRPIAFITNPIKANIELPIKIGSNFQLRKATINEIKVIKNHIAPLFAGAIMNQNPYEQFYKRKGDNESVGTLKNLDSNDLRYFVVELENLGGLNLIQDNPLDALQIASYLTNAELKFDITFYTPKIVTIQHNSLHKQTNNLKYLMFDHYEFNSSDFDELTQTYTVVSKYFHSDDFLTRALLIYRLLQESPDYHDYINLNYFALLEMLVTSRPGINDPSILKQLKVKTKDILDLEGFELNFNKYFEESSENNIWNKLYNYRSCLAHGSAVNFEKEQKKLRSQEIVFKFLKTLLKKIFKSFIFNRDKAIVIKSGL